MNSCFTAGRRCSCSRSLVFLLLFAVLCSACGSIRGLADAGINDAGRSVAQEIDAGTGDAGDLDAEYVQLGQQCGAAIRCSQVEGGVVTCRGLTCQLDQCLMPRARDIDGLGCSVCFPREVRAELRAAWDDVKVSLRRDLGMPNTGLPLYDAQTFTHSLLTALTDCGTEGPWLDEVLSILAEPFTTAYAIEGGSRWGTPNTAEPMLYSTQFAFELSVAMQRISMVPLQLRTPTMQAFVARAPWLWRELYARWLFRSSNFDARGYGCRGGLALALRQRLTVSAWVQTRGDGVVAIAHGSTFSLEVKSGRLAGRVVTSAPSVEGAYTSYNFTSNAVVANGAWHAVALTFDATANQARLFVDGVPVHTEITRQALEHTATGRIHVGGYDYGSGVYGRLAGAIDDLQLHARALSDSEIAALSICRAGPACAGPELVARWPLDGVGDDVVGSSPLELVPSATVAGVNGTPRGAVLFNGTSDAASTKDWSGAHPHATWLSGLRRDLIRDEPTDPRYCAAVSDTDLQLIAGATELLSALQQLDAGAVVTAGERAALVPYFADVEGLVLNRFVRQSVTTWDGGTARAAVFDPGAWAQHPEHEYSAYEGLAYPTLAQRAASPDVAYDLAHAARYVTVFDSLHRRRDVTGRLEPTEDTLRQLTNQLVYRLFEGNLARPRFRNFFEGANGWYRVGYDGRPGFGYQPWDFTSSVAVGGFGFWSRWNPDLGRVMRALLTVAQSNDPEVRAWRADAWGAYWSNGSRVPLIAANWKYQWLMFLPSFALAP